MITDPQSLTRYFDVKESFVLPTGQVQQLAPFDPNRIYLEIALMTPTAPVFITTRPDTVTLEGFPLVAQGAFRAMGFAFHGAAVQMAWFSPGPWVVGTEFWILEVAFLPREG